MRNLESKDPVIRAKSLTKRYRSAEGELLVLDNIDLEFQKLFFDFEKMYLAASILKPIDKYNEQSCFYFQCF